MSREEPNKITKKRKHYQIENDEDEKSINWSENSSQNESQEIENLSKFQIRKRMLKSISEDSHKLIKVSRRSTLTDNQLEDCFGSDIFTDEVTDESSEYSGESDENEINITPLTSIFKKNSKWNRYQLSFKYLK